jgi:hypothetical protein
MPPVPAAPQIRESRTRACRQTKRLVQLAIGEQPGIRGDVAAVELQLQPAIELELNRGLSRVTRRMSHAGTTELTITY